MDSPYFSERLLLWQPFFITVAGVSGTLVGLLFMSLSLNREQITAAENRRLFRLARRSFSDFLYVLLIALFFLIPLQNGHHLGTELLVLGAFRVRLFFAQIWSVATGQKPALLDLVWEYVLPVLATVGLVIAGVQMYEGEIITVHYFVVPVIATLLVTACSKAWQLLIMEKK